MIPRKTHTSGLFSEVIVVPAPKLIISLHAQVSSFTKSYPCSSVYEELYNQGASLNDQYSFPDVLMYFGAAPTDNRTDWEVEADYVTEQKSVRCTPLIRAIQMQNFDLVKRLLKDGADPNARDSLQRVPLVHAIRRVS